MDQQYKSAKKIVSILKQHGYEAYFVGGCVRDTLLNRVPKDYDIVTNAKPQQVASIFNDTKQIGLKFGVVLVKDINGLSFEIVSYRSDGTYSDGRRPDNIAYSFNKEADVLRRDFTINALLLDPDNNQIIDLIGGQEDLKNKTIRCIGNPNERFQEDFLRMLRAIRFSVCLGFEIESETKKAICNNAYLISRISIERIVQELEKMWLSNAPDKAFQLLFDTKLLFNINELDFHNLFSKTQSYLERSKEACINLSDFDKKLLIWFIVLKEVPYFADYNFLLSFKFSKTQINKLLKLYKYSNVLLWSSNHFDWKTNKILLDIDKDLLLAYQASCANKQAIKYTKEKISFLEENPLTKKPFLSGDDIINLGYKPGPDIKKILKELEILTLERQIKDKKEAIQFVGMRKYPAKVEKYFTYLQDIEI